MTDDRTISVPLEIHIICGILMFSVTQSLMSAVCNTLLSNHFPSPSSTYVLINYVFTFLIFLLAYFLCRRNYVALVCTQLAGLFHIGNMLYMFFLSFEYSSIKLVIVVADKMIQFSGWPGYVYIALMIGVSVWIICTAEKNKSVFSSSTQYSTEQEDEVPNLLSDRSKRVLLGTVFGTVILFFAINIAGYFLLPESVAGQFFSYVPRMLIGVP